MKNNALIASAETRLEFSKLKLAMSLDYIFGKGISKKINLDGLKYEYSRKTGRLRYVIDPTARKVLFSFRSSGSIAPTVEGAKLLLRRSSSRKVKRRPRFVVTVLDGVSQVVSDGRNVFCKHIVSCDKNLLPGEDVIVMNENGALLAVGTTLLSGSAMKQFKRGAAINVREGSSKENAPALV